MRRKQSTPGNCSAISSLSSSHYRKYISCRFTIYSVSKNNIMKHFKNGIAILFACLLLQFSFLRAQAQGGESVFKNKCTSCHTIGAGKLIGPDLKGVTTRRDSVWLFRQIKEPDKLIAENDPIATQLVKEVGLPMAPLGLSDADVLSVIAYLKSTEASATAVSGGTPPQFWPTILIGLALVAAFTLYGLKAGKKKVEVRDLA